MERKWYKKDNGLTILHGEPEDVARNHPSAMEIPERPGEDYEWVEDSWKKRVIPYDVLRRAEYPEIGVQLDAILKQFKLMDSSLELCPDMQSIISSWEAVKAKYPKPEESQ